MAYRIYDRNDNLVGGDDQLDAEVRRAAGSVGGYVIDDAGKLVFDGRDA